mmetsp:Transcript_12172/g.34490  ORF Transcript_12172/g.34490 Transcript_12172/m.34490 type:complete len:275 (-) Transcript_12172:3115-3939(-)
MCHRSPTRHLRDSGPTCYIGFSSCFGHGQVRACRGEKTDVKEITPSQRPSQRGAPLVRTTDFFRNDSHARTLNVHNIGEILLGSERTTLNTSPGPLKTPATSKVRLSVDRHVQPQFLPTSGSWRPRQSRHPRSCAQPVAARAAGGRAPPEPDLRRRNRPDRVDRLIAGFKPGRDSRAQRSQPRSRTRIRQRITRATFGIERPGARPRRSTCDSRCCGTPPAPSSIANPGGPPNGPHPLHRPYHGRTRISSIHPECASDTQGMERCGPETPHLFR